SFDTPGISATTMIPWASSKISTSGSIATCSRLERVPEFSVLTTSCVPSIFASLLNLDLSRFRGLTPLNGDLQYAVSVSRIDPIRVGVVRERDDPVEIAIET